jgi:hypothetical protein
MNGPITYEMLSWEYVFNISKSEESTRVGT